ncbi:MAG: twin-arginine translocation signal domain-containing protein [Campylobacterales bacterium]
MAQSENERREFLKRSAVAGAVVAGSVGFVAVTTHAHARGEASGNGVVVGRSKKTEILYQKTQNWEQFYKTAL